MRNIRFFEKRIAAKENHGSNRATFSITSTDVLEKEPTISNFLGFNIIPKPSIFKGRKKKPVTIFKSSTFNSKSNSSISKKSIATIVPSKIVEMNLQNIVVECLTDRKNEIYELREFPSILFEKYKGLKVGTTFNLNIYQSSNNIHIEISNLNDSSLEGLFETSKLFDDLEDFENIHFQ